MAISKDLNFKGVEVRGAYIQAEMVTVLPGSSEIEFTAVTRAARGMPELKKEVFQGPYALDGENPLRQAYAYLKTRHEFEGATDC